LPVDLERGYGPDRNGIRTERCNAPPDSIHSLSIAAPESAAERSATVGWKS